MDVSVQALQEQARRLQDDAQQNARQLPLVMADLNRLQSVAAKERRESISRGCSLPYFHICSPCSAVVLACSQILPFDSQILPFVAGNA